MNTHDQQALLRDNIWDDDFQLKVSRVLHENPVSRSQTLGAYRQEVIPEVKKMRIYEKKSESEPGKYMYARPIAGNELGRERHIRPKVSIQGAHRYYIRYDDRTRLTRISKIGGQPRLATPVGTSASKTGPRNTISPHQLLQLLSSNNTKKLRKVRRNARIDARAMKLALAMPSKEQYIYVMFSALMSPGDRDGLFNALMLMSPGDRDVMFNGLFELWENDTPAADSQQPGAPPQCPVQFGRDGQPLPPPRTVNAGWLGVSRPDGLTAAEQVQADFFRGVKDDLIELAGRPDEPPRTVDAGWLGVSRPEGLTAAEQVQADFFRGVKDDLTELAAASAGRDANSGESGNSESNRSDANAAGASVGRADSLRGGPPSLN